MTTDILTLADSQYLVFREARATGKTKRWDVMSKTGGYRLAQIRWHGAWRQYCFYPEPTTVWNVGCLGDVQNFIDHQMALRKKART